MTLSIGGKMKKNVTIRTNDSVVPQVPLEMLERKIGVTKKEFKKFSTGIPCTICIVLAACKGKSKIDCDILLRHYQACLAYGGNTLILHNDMTKLFPNCASFNGTIVL